MTTENTDKGQTPAEADSQGHCALGDGSAPAFISAHDDDLARDMADCAKKNQRLNFC